MATAEYDRNNCTRVNLKLNNKTDADIIERLGGVENVQGYIKAIIRNEMEGERTMKHFERKTFELYGARNAGWRLAQDAEVETDTQLFRILAAERGERFVDDKVDSLCDFAGDLYEDEDGIPCAVEFVWFKGHEVPLCWHRLVKAEYRIKPEYIDLWGGEAGADTVVNGADVAEIARGWEKPADEIFEQLELIG